MELGEKLASFDIETDTDVSIYPTDTGWHDLHGTALHYLLSLVTSCPILTRFLNLQGRCDLFC